jgi:hypothetical protein
MDITRAFSGFLPLPEAEVLALAEAGTDDNHVVIVVVTEGRRRRAVAEVVFSALTDDPFLHTRLVACAPCATQALADLFLQAREMVQGAQAQHLRDAVWQCVEQLDTQEQDKEN